MPPCLNSISCPVHACWRSRSWRTALSSIAGPYFPCTTDIEMWTKVLVLLVPHRIRQHCTVMLPLHKHKHEGVMPAAGVAW